MKTGLFIHVTRSNFLPASIIPFLAGAALAFQKGAAMNPFKMVLGLAGVSSAHLAGNLFNDYFDHKSGADTGEGIKSPFFGGSGVIQNGLFSARDVLLLAVAMLAVSVFSAFGVFFITGDPVFLLIMALVGLLTVSYTAPPLKLAYNRMGEADIFFLFGVFLVMGGFYLFAGSFTLDSLAVSLPVSFLITAVIICNEVPDIKTDTQADKNNLVSLAGKDKGYLLYGVALVLSYASVLWNISRGTLPAYSALLVVLYMPGWLAFGILRDKHDDQKSLVKASGLTVLLHMLLGLGIIAGILAKA
ncbi:MAG: hypothetical protein GF409_07900 [Candidatus Omnitrophica bacterium]|nr:hypothetical protein [Candidatus Omnitrophota bacterium]